MKLQILILIFLSLGVPLLATGCNPYPQLHKEKVSTDMRYSQINEPSKQQKMTGERAFELLKSKCSDTEYCQIMHDLVAGRTLVGKTKKQVIDAFGTRAGIYEFVISLNSHISAVRVKAVATLLFATKKA